MYKFRFFARVFFLLVPVLSCLDFVIPDKRPLSLKQIYALKMNNFGSDLLQGLYKSTAAEDNILVSPLNAYVALALLHLGADNSTRGELMKIMKISSSATLHKTLKDIISDLTSVQEDAKYHETSLANGIFLQNNFPIKDSYLQSAKQFYLNASEAKNVDFNRHSQESTDTINNWISESTKGRIPKFYENPLSIDTVAVLVSALYFNAKWRHPFSEETTKKEKFHTSFGEIEVPMMNLLSNELYYDRHDGLHYESVSIPYSGDEYEMTIHLQDKEQDSNRTLADLYKCLAEHNILMNSGADRSLVRLKLPKIKFAWKNSVVNALKLETILRTGNFSELSPTPNLALSDIIHATELEVHENGTIATAATAVEISLESAFIPTNPEPINFNVDRPFLMTITHKPTGIILFTGIVRKPM